MKKAKRPCVGVKRGECLYTEDEYLKYNRAPLAKCPQTDDEIRADYRRLVAAGHIPPTCPICGWAHKILP